MKKWRLVDDEELLLNQTQAAKRRNVARSTLLKWIKAGLPVTVIAGRRLIRQADLDNYQPARRGPKGKGQ